MRMTSVFTTLAVLAVASAAAAAERTGGRRHARQAGGGARARVGGADPGSVVSPCVRVCTLLWGGKSSKYLKYH